jgi:hypothetical protein
MASKPSKKFVTLSQIPSELRELTILEETMNSLYRVSVHIVKLGCCRNGVSGNLSQKALKGSIISFPNQMTGKLLSLILFCSHNGDISKAVSLPNLDTLDWLQVVLTFESYEKAERKEYVSKYGKVRKSKVRNALIWLRKNNELYQNVIIDQKAIESLPEDDIPDRFMQESVVVAMESEDLGKDNGRNDRVAYVDSNSGSNLSFDQASQMCISELILKVRGYILGQCRRGVFLIS